MSDARTALREAEAACTRAILLDRQGRTGEALIRVAVPVRRPVPRCHDHRVPAGPGRLIRPDQGAPGPARAPAAAAGLQPPVPRSRSGGTAPGPSARSCWPPSRPIVSLLVPSTSDILAAVSRRMAGRRPDHPVLARRTQHPARRPRPGAVRHQAVQAALEHRPGRPRARPRGRRRRSGHTSGTTAGYRDWYSIDLGDTPWPGDVLLCQRHEHDLEPPRPPRLRHRHPDHRHRVVRSSAWPSRSPATSASPTT